MKRSRDILVVDDDPDLLESVRVILEGAGHRVRTAGSAREARAELEIRRPDLLILDVMMETETEGLDLACELKAGSEYADLPLVLLTCFLDRMRGVGTERFQHVLSEPWPALWLFEKPVRADRLLDRVAEIMAERSPEGGPDDGVDPDADS